MNEQDMQQIGAMIARQIGTVVEDMQHKIDLIIEGQQGLVEQVGRLDGRMDRLEGRMDSLEVKVECLDAKIDAVEQRLDAKIDAVEQRLSTRIDGLDSKLDAVAADLSAHRRDTEAHSGYRVGE